ncbi:MAG: MATE family efflux transporter, partial [Lachnospiraceae bacterium]|nr:MATE family efflux transporter [Lachnospiraceae bacterium]
MTSLVSRKLGEKRRDLAEQGAVHGIVLSVVTSLVFVIYGIFFTTPFFRLFESDPEIIAMGDRYLTICCAFSLGLFVLTMLEKTLQATGNMIWPMIFQLIGAVTNIILDPIFIFGYFGFPAMGVTGAAAATVAGQWVCMIVCIIVTKTGKHEISLSFRGFRLVWSAVRDIYQVGIPAIFMQAIGTVMNVAMNGILSGFSTAAYTVFGLYFRLQSFVFMPVFGLTQGLLPIMGYNYGAQNKKRLMSALKNGCGVALVIMIAGLLLFELIPGKLIGLFSPTEEIMTIGVRALQIIAACFPFAALGIVSSTMFQAPARGTYSLIISLLCQLVVLVPAAWLLGRITGEVTAVWWSFPIAELVSMGVSISFFIRIYQKE